MTAPSTRPTTGNSAATDGATASGPGTHGPTTEGTTTDRTGAGTAAGTGAGTAGGGTVTRADAVRAGAAGDATTPVERLEARLDMIRASGRAALVAYGVAGYPDPETSVAAFRAMAEAGADVLEVGPPYSDPIIDGPVIQRAVTRALDQGITLDRVLGLVREVTTTVETPVVLLVYYNLIARRGHDAFATALAEAGACGAVVPDLPTDEADDWVAAAGRAGVAPIFLAAPTSTDARLAAVGERVRGFVYAQASLGVTGLRAALAAGVDELIERVRAHTDRPVCVGIGVSNPEQASTVARFADGVIVGTALVKALGDGGVEGVRRLTGDLAKAVRNAR